MTTQLPPGPQGNFLLGNLQDFSQDQPNYLLSLAQTYGAVTTFRLLHYRVFLLSDSAQIRQVLVSESDNFPKSKLDTRILGKFLGQGLLTSNGDFHRRQRRLAQPAFHTRRIRNYAEVMVDYTTQAVAGWEDGQERDIAADMMRLTMFIVAKTLFDADAVAGSQAIAVSVGDAIHDLQAASNADYRRGFLIPDWIPTANNRKRNLAVSAYDDTINAIIGERRASAHNGAIADSGDLLSMLMLSQDEDGGTMNDRQLRDEVATLFAAGHETTSNALSWTWYLLAQHPRVEAKLQAECDTFLQGRPPTLADLSQLPYTLQVLKESMRLYPPAWILNGRVALAEAQIGGYHVPAGSTIFISPWVNHRLENHFPEPERFLPERWTPEMEKALPKYAYLPFGGGPRICIGNAFAMMEAQLILATITQRFQLRLQDGYEATLNPQITLSPAAGLPMIVQRRDRAVSVPAVEQATTI